jgi:hypothetical protein
MLALTTTDKQQVILNNSDNQTRFRHTHGNSDENSTTRIQVTDRYIKLLGYSLLPIVPITCTPHMYLTHILYPVYLSKYKMACGGTRWPSWLRHCATNRKVAGSIPNGVIRIFH